MENFVIGILVIGATIFLIRRGIPGLLTWQGYSHQDRGEYKTAEQYFLKALSFEKTMEKITGQQIGVALEYSNLGLLYHKQQRINDAVSMLSRAIDIYTSLGRLNDCAPVYASLGKVYFDNRDLELSEEMLRKALNIYSRRKYAQEAIDTINQLLDSISKQKGDESSEE